MLRTREGVRGSSALLLSSSSLLLLFFGCVYVFVVGWSLSPQIRDEGGEDECEEVGFRRALYLFSSAAASREAFRARYSGVYVRVRMMICIYKYIYICILCNWGARTYRFWFWWRRGDVDSGAPEK